MDIITYLNNNNIIVDEKFSRVSDKRNLDVNKQIELIIMVQGKLISNGVTIIPRINSTIGRDIESFRVQIKKVEKKLNELNLNNNKNGLDYYILEEGLKSLERAKRSFSSMDNNTYYDLIRRSMRNYELCLGRVDEGNLKIDDNGTLKIRTVKYISYNLIEHDLFNYIKRVKRKNFNIQVEEIIDEFIYKSSLSDNSRNYLKSICNYPTETMKLIYKYESTDNEGSDEWVKRIKSTIDIDGDEIV